MLKRYEKDTGELKEVPLDMFRETFDRHFRGSVDFVNLCKALTEFFDRASEEMYDGYKYKHTLRLIYDEMREKIFWGYYIVPKNAKFKLEAFSDKIDASGKVNLEEVSSYFKQSLFQANQTILQFNKFYEERIEFPERLPREDIISDVYNLSIEDATDLVSAYSKRFILDDGVSLKFDRFFENHTGWIYVHQLLDLKTLRMNILLNHYETFANEPVEKPREAILEDIKDIEFGLRNWNNYIAEKKTIRKDGVSITGR